MPENSWTLWCTGLSAAGKSTLCEALVEELRARGVDAAWLDGDEVRTNLSQGLGFAREDRVENARRVAYVASWLNRFGVPVLVSLISPYAEMRDIARRTLPGFVETYVKCSIDQCAERDPKKLYAKAKAGELRGFTGISDPYEEPEHPDLVVDTERLSPREAVAFVLNYLEETGRIPDRGMRRVDVDLDTATYDQVEAASRAASLDGPGEFLRLVATEAAQSLAPTPGEAADGEGQNDEVVLARLRDLGYID